MSNEVLDELVRTGKVSQEDVNEARARVDETLRSCAFMLHSLMCKEEHEMDPEMVLQPMMNKCKWYLEEQIDLTWEAPDHKFWLEKAWEVMRDQELDEPGDLREFLRKFADVLKAVQEMVGQYPNSFLLLSDMFRSM